MTLLRTLLPGFACALLCACPPTDRKYADAAVDAGLDPDGESDASSTDGSVEDASDDRDGCVGTACSGACEPACGAEAPVCSAGTCGACAGDDQCESFAATPHCVGGACVACAGDADCSEPAASACDPQSHTCVPCAPTPSGPDAQCAHIPDAHVCSGGACVQCTADDDEACGNNVCDVTRQACDGTRTKRSKSVCNCPPGQVACDAPSPCVSDDECQVGQACVMDKAGAGKPVCMTVASNDALCVRPFFSKSAALTSMSGKSVVVCTYATATSCQAQADWRSKRCGSPVGGDPSAASDLEGSGDNAKCGAPSLDDGVCVKYLSQYLCTVACKNSTSDCPKGASSCIADGTVSDGGRCSTD